MCCSGDDQKNEIDLYLQKDCLVNLQTNKLLLIGLKNSGKSTLARHIANLYGPGYSTADRKNYRDYVYRDTIRAIKTLSYQVMKYGGLKKSASLEAKVAVDLAGEAEPIDEKLARHIATLWQDPGIQTTYEKRAHYALTDSCRYFMNKIHEIGKSNYMPDNNDILRISVKRTGLIEHSFTYEGAQFVFVDPGGQRNSRKKWLPCFENVRGLLFVVALSSYDQLVSAAPEEKRTELHEALDLFQEFINNRWFQGKDIILFLNKHDIFKEKIAKVPLKQFFPAYSGGPSAKEAAEYINSLFEAKNLGRKMIFTHLTCATDPNNIAKVFQNVGDMIIRGRLVEGGLI